MLTQGAFRKLVCLLRPGGDALRGGLAAEDHEDT